MTDAYARGSEDPPLLAQTIGANLQMTIDAVPERDALVSCAQGLRYSWREFGAAVGEVARGLHAAGLRTGDRLGIWSPNCAEWTLVQYATARLGIILVNVNPAYRTSELRYAVQQSGCRMLVSARAFKSSDYVAMVDEVRGELDALERVVFLDGPDWAELLAEGAGVDDGVVSEIEAGLSPADPINIQYTSGTTGFPKGATLTHRNLLNNGYFVGSYCRFGPEDRLCIPVPFYHCFGMVMGNLGCTTHGTTMVIPAPGFEPGATLAACAQERCTALYGVPTMFIAMLDDPALRDPVRPVVAADRDHGRLAVSGRGDARVIDRHAHDRGEHRLRHDRDQPVSLQTAARRPARQAGRVGRPGAPAPRGEGDRSRRRGRRWRAATTASCARAATA